MRHLLIYFGANLVVKMVEEAIVSENDGKSVTAAADNESKSLFSVEILRMIREAQKQHGLRHGDYQRYRGM